MLRYSYVSNGFVQHSLDAALEMLSENGYSGIGLVLDPHHFNPFAADLHQRVKQLARRLEQLELSVVIETGASFLLDPKRKHEPTLVSPKNREKRHLLMELAINIASELNAETVSFWSGVVHDNSTDDEVWDRLLDGCELAINKAQTKNVQLAFEPEPGMFIDTYDRYLQLKNRLGNPAQFGLTLDVGHIRCNEPYSERELIHKAAQDLCYVQIDDMEPGVHEHLNFGDGSVDFPSALSSLKEVGYSGLISVELSRHSHAAHVVIPNSISFLRKNEGVV